MNLKSLIKCLPIVLASVTSLQAQEATQKNKIDGVAAVVGDYIVLDSDVDKMYIELKSQGVSTEDFTRCNLMGKLLEDKLYAHHAIQDSIIVSDDEIDSDVNQQIDYMKAQMDGDMQKVLAFYKKDDEAAFRKELFELIKTNRLASRMTKKIVEDVEISPEEVYAFFNSIPENERPTFGTELKIAQIVMKPVVTQEETDRVIDQLKQFKADVTDNGASFSSKAVLYSQDPGSSSKGGKLPTMHRKKPRMVKEFREVAFSLEEGEISDPFKTDFGYHIIMVDKIRGQEVDARHILLRPKTNQSELTAAKENLEKLRTKVMNGEISFGEAALEFSDEKETKYDGGLLRNPETFDHSFELTKMDPTLYSQVINLKEGEVSNAIFEQSRSGESFYKILMVTDRKEEHVAEYGKDFLKIKELALKEKQIKAIAEWQQEKIKDTYIKITGEYRDCEYANNWLKK